MKKAQEFENGLENAIIEFLPLEWQESIEDGTASFRDIPPYPLVTAFADAIHPAKVRKMIVVEIQAEDFGMQGECIGVFFEWKPAKKFLEEEGVENRN